MIHFLEITFFSTFQNITIEGGGVKSTNKKIWPNGKHILTKMRRDYKTHSYQFASLSTNFLANIKEHYFEMF